MPNVTRVARTLSRAFPGLPPLLLLTDAVRLPDPRPALERLPAGSAVIFRHYGVPGRAALAAEVAAACRSLRLKLLIAADPGLAVALGADGMHWPEGLVPSAPGVWARARRARAGWLVTAAAHSETALRRAAAAGADAALLSPVFETQSHPDRATLGPVRFAAMVRRADIPVYALGGVDALTAPRLRGSGAAGLAGISFAAA